MKYLIAMFAILLIIGQLIAQKKQSREEINSLVSYIDTLNGASTVSGDGIVFSKNKKCGSFSDFITFDKSTEITKKGYEHCCSGNYLMYSLYYLKDTLIFFHQIRSKNSKNPEDILYDIKYYHINNKFEIDLVTGKITKSEQRKNQTFLKQKLLRKN